MWVPEPYHGTDERTQSWSFDDKSALALCFAAVFLAPHGIGPALVFLCWYIGAGLSSRPLMDWPRELKWRMNDVERLAMLWPLWLVGWVFFRSFQLLESAINRPHRKLTAKER